MKQRASQRIQVAPDVDVAGISRLFGTDIIKCTQRHTALCKSAIAFSLESTGQTHVDQLGTSLRRDDDV